MVSWSVSESKTNAQTTSLDLYPLKFGVFAEVRAYNSIWGKGERRSPTLSL